MKDLDAVFLEFSEKIGLNPALKLSESGRLTIKVDEEFEIDIETSSDDQKLHIYTVIGRLPESIDPKFFREMLEANLFGQGSHGAVLSIDAAMHEIVAMYTLPVQQVSMDELASTMESAIEAAQTWRKKLQEAQHRGPERESMAAPMATPVFETPAFLMGRV